MSQIDSEGLARFFEAMGKEYVRNSHIKPTKDLEVALSIKHFCDNLAGWCRDGTLAQSAEVWKDA